MWAALMKDTEITLIALNEAGGTYMALKKWY